MSAMRAVHRRDFEGAFAVLEPALARDPGSTFLARARVFTLIAAGNPEGRDALDRLVQLHPLDLGGEGGIAPDANEVEAPRSR